MLEAKSKPHPPNSCSTPAQAAFFARHTKGKGGTSFLGHLKALGAPHILMSDMFRLSSFFWSRLVTATHHAKSVPTNDARPPREAGT